MSATLPRCSARACSHRYLHCGSQSTRQGRDDGLTAKDGLTEIAAGNAGDVERQLHEKRAIEAERPTNFGYGLRSGVLT